MSQFRHEPLKRDFRRASNPVLGRLHPGLMSSPAALPAAAVRPRLALGAALSNRRFRTFLLLMAGVPILSNYLWQIVILPFFQAPPTTDFSSVYLGAARDLAAGHDPYVACFPDGSNPGTYYPHWIRWARLPCLYPPLLAWALKPALGLNLHTADLIALLVCHLCLVIFIGSVMAALRIRDLQVIALVTLAAISWPPLENVVLERNAHLLLLAASGIWFLAWMRGGRWWGGAAIGGAVALKLVQLPSLLLLGWARRWWSFLAALAVWGALWLIAARQYLPGYVFKVLPVAAIGSGYYRNVTPTGFIARILQPDSFLNPNVAPSPAVKVLGALVALGVVVATAWVLRRRPAGSEGLALQAAAVVAATPLASSAVWIHHQTLLLLPLVVLFDLALRRREWRLVAVAAGAWMLMGPFQTLMILLHSVGISGWTDRLVPDAAVVAIATLWVVVLAAAAGQEPEPARAIATSPAA